MAGRPFWNPMRIDWILLLIGVAWLGGLWALRRWLPGHDITEGIVFFVGFAVVALRCAANERPSKRLHGQQQARGAVWRNAKPGGNAVRGQIMLE